MKHLLLFLILFTQFLFSNELLKQAQTFEKEGNFKEAMLLYKQLATQETKTNSALEKSLSQEKELTTNNPADKLSIKNKNSFETVNDQQPNKTIEQILSSTFDLYPYKENYLLPFSYDFKKRYDRDQTEAKFQISVKKPIAYDLFGLNETINFAYTQKSFWQIYSHSSPFRETNYQPEIYMIIPYNNNELPSLEAYEIGYLHESNGQSINSRSWNRLYLEGYFKSEHIVWIPRVWLRIPEKSSEDDNPDIQEYLGYGDMSLLYAYQDHIFRLLVRNNFKLTNNNKGFIEFNWSFPLFGSQNNFAFVELSSGYGDSLIDYNKEINRASFGISLSR
jgi:phospholipase A1/A2